MKATNILETCLYVSDLAAAEEFYARVLGLEAISREAGRHVFFRAGRGVFLLFNPDETAEGQNEIPGHGARGPGHAAFAMRAGDVDAWRERLAAEGVEIEREIAWPNGAVSLYFRDPAGNCLELATPNLWGFEETE
jgi:catechol 2,3-dioxygenase-like lactoylglutathione lyase family enzyme